MPNGLSDRTNEQNNETLTLQVDKMCSYHLLLVQPAVCAASCFETTVINGAWMARK